MIYEYDDLKGEPHAVAATNISPYLTDTPSVLIDKRSAPVCNVPEIVFGSKAVDFGHFILDQSELEAFLAIEPQARPFIREYIGGEEFLNGSKRFCLWLKGIAPAQLRNERSVEWQKRRALLRRIIIIYSSSCGAARRLLLLLQRHEFLAVRG